MYANDELNAELYKLSGWETSEDKIHGPMNCPEYPLGYLLRKLPTKYNNEALELFVIGNRWTCQYDDGGIEDNEYPTAKADTPEDAACKLAIELFKQGILVRV